MRGYTTFTRNYTYLWFSLAKEYLVNAFEGLRFDELAIEGGNTRLMLIKITRPLLFINIASRSSYFSCLLWIALCTLDIQLLCTQILDELFRPVSSTILDDFPIRFPLLVHTSIEVKTECLYKQNTHTRVEINKKETRKLNKQWALGNKECWWSWDYRSHHSWVSDYLWPLLHTFWLSSNQLCGGPLHGGWPNVALWAKHF